MCRFLTDAFHPINMEFGHHIPRVVRYSAIAFLSHLAYSSGFIQDFLDHYTALQRQRQYLLTCKVSKYCSLALHGSRPIIRTNVGLMMYMSGDSPFIA